MHAEMKCIQLLGALCNYCVDNTDPMVNRLAYTVVYWFRVRDDDTVPYMDLQRLGTF